MPEITASPLSWPLWKPRTDPSDRKQGLFRKTGDRGWKRPLSVADARDRVLAELDRYTQTGKNWRVPPDSVILSTNLRTRQDGLPYSNAKEPDDPGVAVYFELDGEAYVLACDTFDRVADNLAAIAGHIEADRRQERYGVGTARDRYAGFKALPAAGEGSGQGWWEVLGVTMGASDRDVKRAYRQRLHETHPDKSDGDWSAFRTVQAAWEQAKAARGMS